MKNLGLTLVAMAALGTTACGGRAKLDDESGRAFRNAWSIQAQSRPNPPLSDLSAADAKIAMRNHAARYSQGGEDSSNSAGGTAVPGVRGLLTPATTDMGDSGGYDAGSRDRSGIRLESR